MPETAKVSAGRSPALNDTKFSVLLPILALPNGVIFSCNCTGLLFASTYKSFVSIGMILNNLSCHSHAVHCLPLTVNLPLLTAAVAGWISLKNPFVVGQYALHTPFTTSICFFMLYSVTIVCPLEESKRVALFFALWNEVPDADLVWPFAKTTV